MNFQLNCVKILKPTSNRTIIKSLKGDIFLAFAVAVRHGRFIVFYFNTIWAHSFKKHVAECVAGKQKQRVGWKEGKEP